MSQNQCSYILLLPEVAVEKIFSFLYYDEIAKNRIVCKKFNDIGSKLLSRGFTQLVRRHAIICKRVKSALPRRESERKTHSLARHNDILQAVETRISMLNMTYTKYIESKLVCFIPGKVLDEIKSVLDLVESNKTPPRTHQLLQELRDLSSMAMEHFDEHILPSVKDKLDQRSDSPEKILKELEVVAGSLTPYPRFQDIICKNVASTSKSTRFLFHQQVQHALTNELHKVKKVTKSHKHHISYLTQNTQKLCLKFRKQTNRIKAQSLRIREQERKIQEQNSKILEQEAALAEIKKHIDEWDQKYKDLTTELVRARDEILLKASTSNSSIINNPLLSPPVLTSNITQNPSYKSNIRPRMAHILPRGYLSFEFERKRKSSSISEVPLKRTRSPVNLGTPEKEGAPQRTGEIIQNLHLNIPDLVDFETTDKNMKAANSLINSSVQDINEANSKNKGRTSNEKTDVLTSLLDNFLTNPLKSVKARKRKMTEDIDLK